jgi:glycerate kinase
MSYTINEELFVELSDEEQQVVAGGGQLIELDQIAKTYLNLHQKKSSTTVVKQVSSDLKGSNVKFAVINNFQKSDYSTGGIEDVWLKFD